MYWIFTCTCTSTSTSRWRSTHTTLLFISNSRSTNEYTPVHALLCYGVASSTIRERNTPGNWLMSTREYTSHHLISYRLLHLIHLQCMLYVAWYQNATHQGVRNKLNFFFLFIYTHIYTRCIILPTTIHLCTG